MSINPLKCTFYRFTGYNPNDEPASDSVIEQNQHFDMSLYIKEYEPQKLIDMYNKCLNSILEMDVLQ